VPRNGVLRGPLLVGDGRPAKATETIRLAEWARVPVHRPISIAIVASQAAITASPVSAATATMLGLLSINNSRFGLTDILIVCIPAGLCGSMLGAIAVRARGDRPKQDVPPMNMERRPNSSQAGIAVAIFLCAVSLIVLSGTIPTLRPMLQQGSASHRLDMTSTIKMVMLSAVVVVILACRFKVKSITDTTVMRAGIQAVFSIIGVAWLGKCFIEKSKQAQRCGHDSFNHSDDAPMGLFHASAGGGRRSGGVAPRIVRRGFGTRRVLDSRRARVHSLRFRGREQPRARFAAFMGTDAAMGICLRHSDQSCGRDRGL
jgi:hypothetical protein